MIHHRALAAQFVSTGQSARMCFTLKGGVGASHATLMKFSTVCGGVHVIGGLEPHVEAQSALAVVCSQRFFNKH